MTIFINKEHLVLRRETAVGMTRFWNIEVGLGTSTEKKRK